MKKYWVVFKICLQDAMAYRLDLVLRTFRYVLNIMMITLVWLAVAHETRITIIDPSQLISYYFFTAILYSLSNFHTDNLEEDIRLGYISKYLVKPISGFWIYLIFQGSIAFLETIMKIIFLVPLLFALGISISFVPLDIVKFAITLPIIFFSMFSLYFSISCMAFWFHAVDSLRMSVMFCFRFLSGIFVPLFLLPASFLATAKWLPFANVAFYPIQLLTGKLSAPDQLFFFGSLLFWSLIFFGAQKIIWQRATHNYESTGI